MNLNKLKRAYKPQSSASHPEKIVGENDGTSREPELENPELENPELEIPFDLEDGGGTQPKSSVCSGVNTTCLRDGMGGGCSTSLSSGLVTTTGGTIPGG